MQNNSLIEVSELFVLALLVILWLYFFVSSYRHKTVFPWSFIIVPAGILFSGIGIPYYRGSTVLFHLKFSLVVSLVGLLWNSDGVQNQFSIRSTRESLRFIANGVILGLLLGFVSIIARMSDNFDIPSNYTTTALISSGIQTGIAEEILFRGFLLGYLTKYKFNHIFAIALQALIFAVLHVSLYLGNWMALSIIFALGVIAGYITWKSNKLIPTLVLHIIFNLVSLTWWLASNRIGFI